MAAILERRRFTVAEFGRLVEFGVFGPDERLELVEGEVVEMVDLAGGRVVCSQPSAGGYRLRRILLPSEDVRFGQLPGVSLPVAELVAW